MYFILKSMEVGPSFRSTVPRYPVADPNYRIIARQRCRYTHYYFYIRDEVLRQGLGLIGGGLLLGLAGSLAIARWIGTLLFNVKPTDPLSFAAVSALLIAAGLLASYLPAHRATRIDPMTALRDE